MTPTTGDILRSVLEERGAHCERHGDYQAMLMAGRWTGCPTCAREQVAQREDGDEEERRRRTLAAWRMQELTAGIPRKFLGSTLDDYRAIHGPKHFQALGQVQHYAETMPSNIADGLGLIMMGTVGTGKSHLGCALLRHALRRHRLTIAYTTAERLCMRIRETYGRSAIETEGDVMRDMLAPELLMLDEIGAGRGSDHEVGVLSSVLSQRYDECKATIIATNLEPALLRDCLGDRATDRLREVAEVVEFQWPSYRAGGAV